ncbi:MAG: YbaK/EbsC family protein [Deltaproteobacteria bacterium]|nr:YbaK/EbsC family protein [Deltaproteobacteria bacterium]
MIPMQIEQYLTEHGLPYEPHNHHRAVTADRMAAAEHTSGSKVAKVVVVRADGELALAVVAASQHLDAERLRMAMGARVLTLAPEESFSQRFAPCETGAEPPLALFGLPIFVDSRLALEPRILMRAGTHEDAIEMFTDDWLLSERARIVDGLGAHHH